MTRPTSATCSILLSLLFVLRQDRWDECRTECEVELSEAETQQATPQRRERSEIAGGWGSFVVLLLFCIFLLAGQKTPKKANRGVAMELMMWWFKRAAV